MDQSKTHRSEQNVVLIGRRSLRIDCVKEVLSFDEQSLLLSAEPGLLQVIGESLRVLALDTERGEIALSGRIDGLFYQSEEGTGREKGLRRLLGG